MKYLTEFPDVNATWLFLRGLVVQEVSEELRRLEQDEQWLDSGTYRVKVPRFVARHSDFEVSFMTYNQIYVPRQGDNFDIFDGFRTLGCADHHQHPFPLRHFRSHLQADHSPAGDVK